MAVIKSTLAPKASGSVGNLTLATVNGQGGSSATYHTLTLTANPTAGGSFTVDGSAYSGPMSLNQGTSHTVVAVPANGYTFVQWSDGSTSASRSVTMSANQSLTATFEAETPGTGHRLTITAENCDVTLNPTQPSGGYESGTSVVATVTPWSGYSWSGWSDGSTDNPRTFTMTQAYTLAATCEAKSKMG